jgi:enamine deaminase RidA (YjgF/YER057c/UK114 family)
MAIKRHGVGPRLSQAVVHGDTVYLAGMVAGRSFADAKGQTQQILKKIDETLAAVGSKQIEASRRHRVRGQHGSLRRHERGLGRLGRSRQHAGRATVEARLASPKYLVEIMCTAAIN